MRDGMHFKIKDGASFLEVASKEQLPSSRGGGGDAQRLESGDSSGVEQDVVRAAVVCPR